jgi:hypothetical protein
MCLEPAALWVVIAAKELGISQGLPPGGHTLKLSLNGHCSMTVLAPINYYIEVKNNVKKPR